MKTPLLRSTHFVCRKVFFSVLLLFSAAAYGQTNSPSLNDLLAQRSALIASGESTSAVDNQLHAQGHNPKAILNIQTLPGGNIEVRCPLYLAFSDQNVAGMFTRLSSNYPYLLSLEKDGSNSLKGVFQSGTSNEQVAEVFNHFGYKGYETQD